ncbi:MAG: hypothetical protein NTV38_12345, partial [Chloroflexi bacterium]|nr:hypothetical protein [Chloroflexota bacterium]
MIMHARSKQLYLLCGVTILLSTLLSACGSPSTPSLTPVATAVPTGTSGPAPQPIPNPPVQSIGQIVFFGNQDDPYNFEIYKINADGTGLTSLTNNPARDMVPAWSPDKSKIAFTSDRDGRTEIYVMNSDGSGVTRLTNNEHEKGRLQASP